MKQTIKLYHIAEVESSYTSAGGYEDVVLYTVSPHDMTQYYPTRFVIGTQEVEFDFEEQNAYLLRHRSLLRTLEATKEEYNLKVMEAERNLQEFLAITHNPQPESDK